MIWPWLDYIEQKVKEAAYIANQKNWKHGKIN